MQYKNIFGDDFQLNQLSYQHLFRSGGGGCIPRIPPVSAPSRSSQIPGSTNGSSMYVGSRFIIAAMQKVDFNASLLMLCLSGDQSLDAG